MTIPITPEWAPRLIELRHRLHRHPELSGEETGTQAVLADWLRAHGVETTPVLGTGLRAELTGTGPGDPDRYVLLRADIDALPVTERTDAPFASEVPGVMHACGHDTHAAMLAVALAILRAHPETWAGRVRGIFQPAEETNTHTGDLTGAGVLTPDLTRAFALHVLPSLAAGTYNLMPGPVMAGSKRFTLTLDGPGGHGGNPHLGSDGLMAAAELLQSLQLLVARRIDPRQMAVISVGTLTGGTAWNVLAGHVRMDGSTRFYDAEVGEQIAAEITRRTEAIAERHRMHGTAELYQSMPPVTNDAEVCRAIRAELTDHPAVPVGMAPLTVSEDFSRYLTQIPGALAFLGTGDPADPRTLMPLHDACFLPPDRILIDGVALHLAAVS